jgi:hypothetical protein
LALLRVFTLLLYGLDLVDQDLVGPLLLLIIVLNRLSDLLQLPQLLLYLVLLLNHQLLVVRLTIIGRTKASQKAQARRILVLLFLLLNIFDTVLSVSVLRCLRLLERFLLLPGVELLQLKF